jgi:hypothetical protein
LTKSDPNSGFLSVCSIHNAKSGSWFGAVIASMNTRGNPGVGLPQ